MTGSVIRSWFWQLIRHGTRLLDINLTFVLMAPLAVYAVLGIPQLTNVWMDMPYVALRSNPILATLFVVLVPTLVCFYSCGWVAVIPNRCLRHFRSLPGPVHDLAFVGACWLFALPLLRKWSFEWTPDHFSAVLWSLMLASGIVWCYLIAWRMQVSVRELAGELEGYRQGTVLGVQTWLKQRTPGSSNTIVSLSKGMNGVALVMARLLEMFVALGLVLLWWLPRVCVSLARFFVWGIIRSLLWLARRLARWLNAVVETGLQRQSMARIVIATLCASLLGVGGICLAGCRFDGLGYAWPMAGGGLIVYGWILCVTAAWLGLMIIHCTRNGGQAFPIALRTMGRLLAILLVTFAIGEAFWAAAWWWPEIVSYRLYSVWALFHVAFVLCALASVVDVLHVSLRLPIRQFALLGLMVSVMNLPRSEIESARSATAGQSEGGAAKREMWLDKLAARVDTLPDDAPLVFVAASGGGSRAALFATLVLEGLDREQLPSVGGGHRWSNQVAVISGVSGGSLATAYFVAQTATGKGKPDLPAPQEHFRPLRHSFQAELVELFGLEARDVSRFYPIDDGRVVENTAPKSVSAPTYVGHAHRQYHESLQKHLSEQVKPSDHWIVFSSRTDEMCSDFMAALLRGALTPCVGRGRSLRLFWERRFGWSKHTNSGGYDGRLYGDPVSPLVIFNATAAQQGTRFMIGFPPLRDLDSHREELPPSSLASFDPPFTLSLSDAVGISANFPWGVPVARLLGSEVRNERVTIDLIDGGVFDNTGLATIHDVLERLQHVARRGAQERGTQQTARHILQELRLRGVILVEIDSGAKPSFAELPEVRTPLQSLSNSGAARAQLARDWHLKRIGEILQRDEFKRQEELKQTIRQTAITLSEEGGRESVRRTYQDSLRAVKEAAAEPIYHVTFRCNHSSERDVMTAWALGPRDKARILATFYFEHQKWIRLGQPTLSAWLKTRRRADEFVRLVARWKTLRAIDTGTTLLSTAVGLAPLQAIASGAADAEIRRESSQFVKQWKDQPLKPVSEKIAVTRQQRARIDAAMQQWQQSK